MKTLSTVTENALNRIKLSDLVTPDKTTLELYGYIFVVFDRAKAAEAVRLQGIHSIDREEALAILEDRADALYN